MPSQACLPILAPMPELSRIAASKPSESSRAIRRGCSRLATELPVHLRTISGYQPCVMRDLSLTGMRIVFSRECHFASDLRFGSGAQLSWDRFDEYGEFIWIVPLTHAYSAGIRFYDSIEPQTIFGTRDLHDSFWMRGRDAPPEYHMTRRWVEQLNA